VRDNHWGVGQDICANFLVNFAPIDYLGQVAHLQSTHDLIVQQQVLLLFQLLGLFQVALVVRLCLEWKEHLGRNRLPSFAWLQKDTLARV